MEISQVNVADRETPKATGVKGETVGADLSSSSLVEQGHQGVVANWSDVGRRVEEELSRPTANIGDVAETVRIVENARRIVDAEFARELETRLGKSSAPTSLTHAERLALGEERLAQVAETLEQLRAPLVRYLEQVLRPFEGRAVDADAVSFASKVMVLADMFGLRIKCECTESRASTLQVWQRSRKKADGSSAATPSWRLRHDDKSDCYTSQTLHPLMFMAKPATKNFAR